MSRRTSFTAWALLVTLLVSVPVFAPPSHAQDRECASPEPLHEVPAPPNHSAQRSISTGQGVKVAVIDTGVFPHPQLARVMPGADFVAPAAPNPLFDCDGHGTIVAGIIAGHDYGIAPDAHIVSIRQTSGYFEAAPDTSETTGSLETLAHAIHDAVNNGADVINISVVSCVSPSIATRIDDGVLRQALERAEAEQALVVAAAGNVSDVCPQGSFVYPAHLPTVIAVGARDSGYDLADYSVATPQNMASVSAAGSPLAALSPQGDGFAAGIITSRSGTVEYFAGTSFAAPVVSGIAATLKQRYPTETAAQLRQRIYAAAEPADGYLDPYAALTDIPPSVPAQMHPVEVTPAVHADDGAVSRAGLISIVVLVMVSCVIAVHGIFARNVCSAQHN
ncbi:S8 family serine peptidase [Corynebacterium sp. S7]